MPVLGVAQNAGGAPSPRPCHDASAAVPAPSLLRGGLLRQQATRSRSQGRKGVACRQAGTLRGSPTTALPSSPRRGPLSPTWAAPLTLFCTSPPCVPHASPRAMMLQQVRSLGFVSHLLSRIGTYHQKNKKHQRNEG